MKEKERKEMIKMLVNFSSVEEKVIFNRVCDLWLSKERRDNLEDYSKIKARMYEIKDEILELEYNKDRFIDEASWDYTEWGVFVEYVSRKTAYEGTLINTKFENWSWNFNGERIVGTLDGVGIVIDIDELLKIQELVNSAQGACYRDPEDPEIVWGYIVGQRKLLLTKKQVDELIANYDKSWVDAINMGTAFFEK